ncbi:hypothetical protein AB0G04_05210 [Actinoplanes sp. NPDC023801]|uniref:hypothetical protein n=1 Tax=Actinoplanes sp. NPDC023801 TaxID=3154595 RepID=UPI0033E265AD
MIGALRAEVIKLVTLPSLRLTLALTWAVTLLLRLTDPPRGVVAYGQIGVLVLGVLAAGHEYQAGGQIRASLLAVPRRPLLAVAKIVALTATAAPFVLVTALLAGEPGATGGLLLDLLVAAAVGTVLRHPVGATGVVLTAYEIGVPLVRTHLPDVALPSLPVWAAAAIVISVATFCRREA